MVGQGVLRECLLDPGVEQVLSVGRSPIGQQHPKLRELIQADLLNLAPIEKKLQGCDACFFCLGVSSAGMTEEAYRRVTYDLTLAVARTLAQLNPGMTFIYVSGAGTDSSERGRSMWRASKAPPKMRCCGCPSKPPVCSGPAPLSPCTASSRRRWPIESFMHWPGRSGVHCKPLFPRQLPRPNRSGGQCCAPPARVHRR